MSGPDVLVFMALVAVLVATHACSYALGKLDGAAKRVPFVPFFRAPNPAADGGMGAHEPPPAELYRRALRERAAAQPRERGRFVAPKEGA